MRISSDGIPPPYIHYFLPSYLISWLFLLYFIFSFLPSISSIVSCYPCIFSLSVWFLNLCNMADGVYHWKVGSGCLYVLYDCRQHLSVYTGFANLVLDILKFCTSGVLECLCWHHCPLSYFTHLPCHFLLTTWASGWLKMTYSIMQCYFDSLSVTHVTPIHNKQWIIRNQWKLWVNMCGNSGGKWCEGVRNHTCSNKPRYVYERLPSLQFMIFKLMRIVHSWDWCHS